MTENKLNIATVINIYSELAEVVDSGNPEQYKDIIKAASFAIYEVMQLEESRQEFSRRYGEHLMRTLLVLTEG
jgi:phage-related minor tail protein